MWTLALVAGWRVVLMTRVLSVLTGRSAAATFFHVMLLADAMVIIGLSVAKLPLLQFMAEIQLTNSEAFLAVIVFWTTIVAVLSFPAWLIGAILAFFSPRRWNSATPGPRSGSRMVWLVAAGSVAAGLLALPWTQPEQRLATRAESLLRGGCIEEALAMMSGHRRSDFPPQWEPPPRVGYREQKPPLLDVLDAMTQTPTADWVRQAYVSSFERAYLQADSFAMDTRDWPRAAGSWMHCRKGRPFARNTKSKFDRTIDMPSDRPILRRRCHSHSNQIEITRHRQRQKQ